MSAGAPIAVVFEAVAADLPAAIADTPGIDEATGTVRRLAPDQLPA